MTTIKSYTDLEQSKVLSKILPLESADMGWYYSRNLQAAQNQMWVGTKAENADIPCWSLAALLELLPKRLQIVDNVYELSVYFYGLYYWNTINGNICFESKGADNLVDACVAMIEKLHELNLL